MNHYFSKRGALSFYGAFMAVALLPAWNGTHYTPKARAAETAATTTNQDTAAIQAELARIKGMLPDQSHAMKDVAYHFANLWFAGEKKNWPLADFYCSETRSHLRWAVRIIPVRKDPQGREIRLSEILDPIEKSSLEGLHKAIGDKNPEKFSPAYKKRMERCY